MSLNIKQTLSLYFFLVVTLSVITITSCNFGPFAGSGSGVGNPGPATFATWNDLETYIKSEYSESAIQLNTYARSWLEGSNVPAAGGNFEMDSYGSEYSQTNVQEAGVDESDKVKTDGEYIYVSSGNSIHIVNAVPADSMSALSTIDVNGAVDSIYLYNDILVVLYNPIGHITHLNWVGDNGFLWGMGLPYWIPVQSQTGILITDVSNPLSPDKIKEWTIDGWMISSRLTNGKLHLVQQFLPDLPPLQYTYNTAAEESEVIAANEQVMASVNLEDLIPYYEVIDEQGSPVDSAPLITPENFYHPGDSEGGSIVSIISFDLDDFPDEFQSVGLIADASTVYASTEALYIAASKWNYGINDSSKDEYYRTSLYKFDLNSDNVALEGYGETKGRIINQFSMGEYNDVLNIATSTGGWGADLRSNIYCLEVDHNKLKIIGRLEGLAPGEDIYAARFIGTRGFLVTFVKVDPLFTIDLSNPVNPVVAGELKVPGYSDYIHPLGDDHLITIGKDAILDENNMVWYQGLQLSIFDVSDFSDPLLLHTELIGDRGTTSEALDNHKAFTFWAENGLLAIPVKLYEHQTEPAYPYTHGDHTFTGLYVYRVTIDGGFEYLGRIDTAPLEETYYYYNWTRGLFIDEDVYAVNAEAVRSAPIEDINGSVSEFLLPVGE